MKFDDAMCVPPSSVTGSCAIGIDQRFGSWDVAVGEMVRTTSGRVIPRLVFYGKIPGEEEALAVMTKYRVVVGMGDVRPEAAAMHRLQNMADKARIRFYLAQYSTAISAVEMTLNSKEDLLTLERTMTLDNVYLQVSTATGIAFPQNVKDIGGGSFIKEMCASTKLPVLWHGQHWSRWSEGGIDDHAMHAINYMLQAIQIGKLHLHRDTNLMAVRGTVESTLEQNYDDESDDVKLWGGGIILEA